MTVAIGRKRVSRPWEDFLRPLQQEIKGVILNEVWGKGVIHLEKAGLGLSLGVCVSILTVVFT